MKTRRDRRQPMPSRTSVRPLLPLLACLVLVGVASRVAAAPPPFAWANVSGTANDDLGRACAVDGDGNTYLAGSFDGTASFSSTVLSSVGGRNRPDMFVAKYHSGGQLEWIRQAGGTGTDVASGITVDSSGNVLVTGSSDSTVLNIAGTGFTVSGKKAVIAKFNSAGSLLWARTSMDQLFFPPAEASGMVVGNDAAGNHYVAGHFTGTINFGGTPGFFPPPVGGLVLTNNSDTDIFLLKYTAGGTVVWARQVSGVNLQEVRSMAVTPAGEVHLAGRFNGTASFGNTNLTSGNTSFDTDSFLAKWNTQGDLQWVKQVGGNDTDLGLAVAVDAAGSAHFVGAFKSLTLSVVHETYANPDLSFDLFAMKFTPSGNLLWSMHIERPAGEPADGGLGAAIDANGNLLLTGSARPGSKFKNLPSPDGTGSLFVALIENGDAVWVKRAGTEGGTASGDFGVGVGQDRAGNIYFGGTLGRNEPGAPALFDGLAPLTAGQRDVFVAKLGGTLPTPEPTLAFTWTGGQLTLSWPLATPDFGVQSSPALGGVFTPVAAPRVTNTVAQTITVTVTPSGSQRFYRLLSL